MSEARLLATVTELSSDSLGGRHSLVDADIRRAATYLAGELQRAGVEPIGGSYLHDFGINVGATVDVPPQLEIISKKRPQAIASSEFGPLPSSGSGSVEGEVVFAGYAARGSGGSNAYDDLAGISVKGKIALVLTEAPDSPNMRELFRVLRRERDAFERVAEPLRTANDREALTKLHEQTRDRLVELIRPYLHGRSVPPELLVTPTDPAQTINISGFAGAVAPSADEPVPHFAYGEARIRTKIDRLTAAGAVGVLLVDHPHAHAETEAHHEEELPELLGPVREKQAALPVLQVKWSTATSIFRIKRKPLADVVAAIDRDLRPQSGPTGVSVRLDVQIQPLEQQAPNILGIIRGTESPDDIVMLGAHYDHIGRDDDGPGHCKAKEDNGENDTICNGADDNASGTAVVVEIARTFAETGYRPKRSIVFALFAGEELGLLGSRAMADNPPAAAPWIADGGQMVAMVNIDMVGRLREEGLLVGGVGSSPGWMPIFDEISDGEIPILFDSTVTTRSDQASFYRLGVPVVFFFTGVHADYHAPGDELDRINLPGLTKVSQFTHDLMVQLGDGASLEFTPGQLTPALPGDDEKNVVKRVGFDQAEPSGSNAGAL